MMSADRRNRRLSRKRGAATVGLIAAVLAGVAVAVVATSRAKAPTATIHVDLHQDLGQISPDIFGVIFNWFHDAAGTYDTTTDTWRAQFVDLAQRAGLKQIRFFGGTLSGDTTDWRDGIGNQSSRPSTRTVAGLAGQVMTAGPDEFGQLVRTIGGDGNAIVNIDESAQDASDYMAYMTTPVSKNPSRNPKDPSYWAQLRKQNGHAEPYDIPVWDVGNEVSLIFDTGAGWATGSAVTVGPHTTVCPTGGEHDCLYAFGGTSHFDDQPAIGRTDMSASADVSTGHTGQSYFAKYPPVRPGSQTVYVNGTAWTAVPNLSGSGPSDRTYTINTGTGEITFGNGKHGEIPPAGSKVTVSYDSGPHDGFVDYYRAMKAVNPAITVCAEDLQPNFLAAMGTTYRYDCVGDHTGLYTGFPSTDLSDGAFVQQLMSAPAAQHAALVKDQTLVDSYAHRHVPVIPSAYGHVQGNFPADDPGEHQQEADGVLQARQLQNFIDLGIPQADKFMMAAELFAPGGEPQDYNSVAADVNGIIQSDGHGHFALMPNGLAIGMMSQLGGLTRVGTSVQDGLGVALPDGTSIPALTVDAGVDRSGNLTIAVVNSSMTDAVHATLDLGTSKVRGEATVSQMAGASPFATNTPTDPNRVRVVTTTQHASGSTVSHVYPAHSVTLITMKTMG